ncbi:ATP-dependent nuclease [Euzebya pacifica]|uniref:ATP-dependent nuclease n=1 Tax=Euzebya pacifica TaxID=1608957 RepID=UPI001C1FB53B|nr:AAA family ATPase [Euzebya pacifica]
MVLVGANACGKSSLLNLIGLALTGSRALLYREITPESLRDRSRALTARLTFSSLSEGERGEFAHELELNAAGESTLQLNIVAEFDERVKELKIDRKLGRDGAEVPVSNLRLASVPFVHLGADRKMHIALGSGGGSVIRQLLRGVELGDDGVAIRKAIDQVHQVVQDASGVRTLKKDVAESLDRVLPTPVAADDVDIDLPSDRKEDPLADFEVKLRGQESPSAFRDNSDGYRSLATIGLQLAAPQSLSILALDEPEVHLHPAAQRRLAKALREAAPQALIATHSTTVLAQFDPAEVVVMAGDGNLRQFHGDTISPRHAVQRWLPSVLEPLTSRGLIAVEGPSDVVAVREVCRALGIDLDRESISVYPVGGYPNFQLLYTLLGPSGFDVPMVTIADGDESAAVAGYLRVAPDDLQAAHVYICREDLEDECSKALGAGEFARLLSDAGVVKMETLLGRAGVADPADLTEEHVARAARAGGKIDSALALAGKLDQRQANAIVPVASAIRDLLGRLV